MPLFRLVHISDLHFSTTPGRKSHIVPTAKIRSALKAIFGGNNPFTPPSHDFRAAKALAHQLYDAKGAYDAILITGDLATTGFEDDLVAAREYLCGRHGAGSALSAQIPAIADLAPLVMVPGNHDRWEKLVPPYSPGHSRFELPNCFGPDWRLRRARWCPTDLGRANGRVHSFHLRKENSVLSICCVDLSIKAGSINPNEYLGKGKATSDILFELERVTKSARATFSNSEVVWAVHFPPHFGEAGNSLELMDEADLVALAERCNVHVMFAGHTHEARDYDIPNQSHSIRVLTCGTTLEYNPGRVALCFQIVDLNLDLTSGVTVERVSRKYWRVDSGKGAFS
jgi:3',5'-cyclic AMP phosphodiesterase CpdA